MASFPSPLSTEKQALGTASKRENVLWYGWDIYIGMIDSANHNLGDIFHARQRHVITEKRISTIGGESKRTCRRDGKKRMKNDSTK